MPYTKFQEVAIYQAIEDLSAWLAPHVGKYSKALRPTLGAQTLDCTFVLLRRCVSAYNAPASRKQGLLLEASAELDCLRLLVKISVTLRLTSYQQFSHASLLIAAVGKQLGGWIGQVNRKGEGG